MRLEIVYLAYNRLGFTEASFKWLVAHTDWKLVDRVVVYDDGSEDGTLEWLRQHAEAPVPTELRIGDFRSPVAVMNHYLQTSEADWFVKIDNDIALPPAWLNRLLQAHSTDPSYELLGMEATQTKPADRGFDGKYRIVPSSHIGGVGLMSVNAFRSRHPMPSRGRMGFTEWQNRYEPKRGWIYPDLNVVQLDRIPTEPWRSLSESYIDAGWQRQWDLYDPSQAAYWKWMGA